MPISKKDFAKHLIGITEKEAQKNLEEVGMEHRVTKRDGCPQPVPPVDKPGNCVDIEVKKDKVDRADVV